MNNNLIYLNTADKTTITDKNNFRIFYVYNSVKYYIAIDKSDVLKGKPYTVQNIDKAHIFEYDVSFNLLVRVLEKYFNFVNLEKENVFLQIECLKNEEQEKRIAHLTSAAPEMYNSISVFLESLRESHGVVHFLNSDKAIKCFKAMRDAIKKADGVS